MIRIFKKTQRDPEFMVLDSIETGSWINLIAPSKEEIDKISSLLNIPEDMLRASLDYDENPRAECEDNIAHIIIRVPLKDENQNKMIMPVSIIVCDKFVITVSLKDSDVISDLYIKMKKKVITTKKTRLMILLLSRANYYFQKYLDEIEKEINSVEKKLLVSSKNKEIIELLGTQKELVYIHSAVVSNGKILQKVINTKIIKLFKEDSDVLNDILIDNEQSIEMVEMYSNILANTMDAYASIVSNNLNIVMKFLASVTIMLAVPSIISGLLGMNIILPLQNSPYAFLYVLLLCFVIMAGAGVIFYKKDYF